MDIVCKFLKERGLSQQATNLVCSSWSKGTEKQYEPVWQKWCSWCSKRKTDPLQGSAELVTNFISDRFKECKSYSTLNSYRTALSSTFHLINNDKVGEHPLVTRCLKGVYMIKAPLPRYESTWDVTKVTAYLSTLYPLEDLNLKLLTLKTVTLCSLVSAQRAQTIWFLDLNNVVILGEAIKFCISERLKTSRPGKKFDVFFPSLPSKHFIVSKNHSA